MNPKGPVKKQQLHYRKPGSDPLGEKANDNAVSLHIFFAIYSLSQCLKSAMSEVRNNIRS